MDIRLAAASSGVKLWQIADALGMTDGNFSRKLRKELPQEEKAKIFAIIERIPMEGWQFIISQMSNGAQKRYAGIKNQFGMDAETYQQAWSIYQNDDLKADQKRAQLSALGYDGSALYKALGQKLG